MKRTVFGVAVLLLCVFRCYAPSESPSSSSFFEYRYETRHPEEELVSQMRCLIGTRLLEPISHGKDVAGDTGRAAHDQVAPPIRPKDRLFSASIIAERTYTDSRSVFGDLPRTFAEGTANTDSLIYYVYAPFCESCAQAEELLESLGTHIQVMRGTDRFESRLEIREINIYEEPGAAQALFERYRSEEERRITPSLFAGDRHFSGLPEIQSAVSNHLPQGEGIGTPELQAVAKADLPAVRWVSAAVGGLTAGFNPCALSMLLMFLLLLSGSGRKVGRYASLFLTVKFVCYLLMGTLLMRVMSALNAPGISLAVRIGVTALACGLAAVNLMDAVAARRERYGEIKNQLPRGIRAYLNGRIRRVLDAEGTGAGMALGLSVAVLGVLVAAGEFLCAGQLYLATLTYWVRTGADRFRTLGMLALFCLMFILPSCALATLVARGRRALELSEWTRRRMPQIKIASAVALIAACLLMWFL